MAPVAAPRIHHNIHAQGHPSQGWLLPMTEYGGNTEAGYFLKGGKIFLILDSGLKTHIDLAKTFSVLQY